LCIKKWGVTGSCAKNLDRESVKTGPYFVRTGGAIQKAIEFKGYSRGIVKLSYVEASGDWSNEMVRRDFEWDPSSGETFSYAGYNLLIEQASSSKLTFKRLKQPEIVQTDNFNEGKTAPNAPQPDAVMGGEELIPVSSGSGFFVTGEGHIITNNHVVAHCAAVKINQGGREIDTLLLATDRVNDLALLKADYKPLEVISIGETKPKLLQEIYVAGFPFGKRVSSSVKVTKGIVSSMTGLGDNYSNIQIDAAVQPGNSGGPILDSKGNGIGVSVSKLELKAILEQYGAVPENTNFGIKGGIVGSLLEANGVVTAPANESEINSTRLGEKITLSTIYLQCLAKRKDISALKAKKMLFKNF
jgi:hypothetical protein